MQEFINRYSKNMTRHVKKIEYKGVKQEEYKKVVKWNFLCDTTIYLSKWTHD